MKTAIRAFFVKKQTEGSMGSTYYWTTLSGILYSGSTFLMFWLASLLVGVYDAGVLTIAMTIGQQLVTIGYFNVRTFQVSDVKERYSFSDYFVFRLLTSASMVMIGIFWMMLGGYSDKNLAAIGILLVFKTAESIADVMEGLYQQKGRYDVTGRCIFYETVIFLGAFLLALFFSRNLLLSLIVMTVCYIVALCIIEGNIVGEFESLRLSFRWAHQKGLFWECLPLFVNSFLMMYINNVAKYAIDASHGEEILTYFNIIYMPAFVINLFGGFLLKPLLTTIAVKFHENHKQKFIHILKRQGLYIAGLAIVCFLGAYILGVPVLSWLYHVDLSPYRIPLCVVVVGGAFTAVYTMFQFAIVIMRHQYACLIGCGITAVTAYLIVPPLAEAYSIAGAAYGYTFTMVLLSLVYFLMTVFYIRKTWISE